MQKLWLRLCLLLVMVSLSACATVSKGTNERVLFETNPPGARVVTEVETAASVVARRKNPKRAPDYYSCEPTPCEIKLSRRTNTVATLTYPGMEPLQFAITSGASRRNLAPNVTGGVATGAAAGSLGVALSTSLGASAGASVIAFAAPAAVVALGVGGTMAMVDMASGAGLQLSPNPLVVTMVPEGTEVVPDPFVEQVRSKNLSGQRKPRVYARVPRYCDTDNSLSTKRSRQCQEARRQVKGRQPKDAETDTEIKAVDGENSAS